MLRVTLIIALLAGAAGLASAAPRVLGQVEGAYELKFASVQMPLNATGSVTLRTCDTCQSLSHRVDADTTYALGSSQMPLPDFLALTQTFRASANASEQVLVMVFYDLETTRVTRIVLHDHRE
jgi:hypothetical protein